MNPDCVFITSGISMVLPVTDAAKVWVADNVALEEWQWNAGAFACEPIYARAIAEGMVNDGLQTECR